MNMSRRAAALIISAVPLLLLFVATPASAFTSYPCHDDTSTARANTHGSPLNGTFGDVGQPPNHSHGYYYLDISTAKADGSACVTSQDGYIHILGQVTANGIGLAAGHPVCSTSAWAPSTNGVDNPTCDPKWRNETGTALAADSPAWGFEIKDAATGAIVACTGGNGAGGTDCPGTLNVTASPGNATVTFRFDNALANHAYRFRLANEYVDSGTGQTDVLWESASFDVVACSTCTP